MMLKVGFMPAFLFNKACLWHEEKYLQKTH
ncbi:Protein of unknown function [Bacillus mycoides]|nr:Protein of unknown function [Bacillus mycoides]